jgi:hypothetical protein
LFWQKRGVTEAGQRALAFDVDTAFGVNIDTPRCGHVGKFKIPRCNDEIWLGTAQYELEYRRFFGAAERLDYIDYAPAKFPRGTPDVFKVVVKRPVVADDNHGA